MMSTSMTLEQAQYIALGLGNFSGYLTQEEQKLVDEAKRLIYEHAVAVLGELKDDQDPEC